MGPGVARSGGLEAHPSHLLPTATWLPSTCRARVPTCLFVWLTQCLGFSGLSPSYALPPASSASCPCLTAEEAALIPPCRRKSLGEGVKEEEEAALGAEAAKARAGPESLQPSSGRGGGEWLERQGQEGG